MQNNRHKIVSSTLSFNRKSYMLSLLAEEFADLRLIVPQILSDLLDILLCEIG